MMMLAPALAMIGGVGGGQLPSRADVEGAMFHEETRWCRDLIDYCLDENGDEQFPVAEFEVSGLECRPLPESMASCSFAAAATIGSQVIRRNRCTSKLRAHRREDGQVFWTFAAQPRKDRRYAPILKCN